MKSIRKSVVDSFVEGALIKLGKISMKITDTSTEKCFSSGFYETEFPRELLNREEEI